MATRTAKDTNKEVKRTARTAERKVEENVSALRDSAEAMGSNVRQFINDKSEQIAQLRKTTEDTVTEHPVASVATAALGGAILGALLKR